MSGPPEELLSIARRLSHVGLSHCHGNRDGHVVWSGPGTGAPADVAAAAALGKRRACRLSECSPGGPARPGTLAGTRSGLASAGDDGAQPKSLDLDSRNHQWLFEWLFANPDRPGHGG